MPEMERCLKSCVSKPEAGLLAIKYLDEMPQIPNVCEIHAPGVNIGHWNRALYHYSVVDGKSRPAATADLLSF